MALNLGSRHDFGGTPIYAGAVRLYYHHFALALGRIFLPEWLAATIAWLLFSTLVTSGATRHMLIG